MKMLFTIDDGLTKSEKQFFELLSEYPLFQAILINYREFLQIPINGFSQDKANLELTKVNILHVFEHSEKIVKALQLGEEWIPTFAELILFNSVSPPQVQVKNRKNGGRFVKNKEFRDVLNRFVAERFGNKVLGSKLTLPTYKLEAFNLRFLQPEPWSYTKISNHLRDKYCDYEQIPSPVGDEVHLRKDVNRLKKAFDQLLNISPDKRDLLATVVGAIDPLE